MTSDSFQHSPVLLEQVLDALAAQPGGRYIDATLGGGGHSAALMAQAGPGASLLGIDADPAALRAAAARLALLPATEPPQQLHLVQGNFRQLGTLAAQAGFEAVNGILLDLGVSSHQLDSAERGFSFQAEAALDMRLDPTQGPTAAELLETLSETELADIIFRYGEERGSRRIARLIVERRRSQPIATTTELAALVAQALGGRHGRIHPATRTFQALRIAVNAELSSLEAVLPQALDLLVAGGRLAVISFHSLEDRIVKHFLRAESGYGGGEQQAAARVQILTKKPITADSEEQRANPRSRSAKLRVAARV